MSIALHHASTLLIHSIGQVTLNPVVTAALLWILTKGPFGLRRKITLLRDPERLEKVVKALKWCLALGVTRVVNSKLNDVALNGGRWKDEKKRWNWGSEVAVVTGGCSGIGALVVKRLVGRGIKVAVLDIQELPTSLQGCKLHFHKRRKAPEANIKCRRTYQVLQMRHHRPICSLRNSRRSKIIARRALNSHQQCRYPRLSHHPRYLRLLPAQNLRRQRPLQLVHN